MDTLNNDRAQKLIRYILKQGEDGVNIRKCGTIWMIGNAWEGNTETTGFSFEEVIDKLPE